MCKYVIYLHTKYKYEVNQHVVFKGRKTTSVNVKLNTKLEKTYFFTRKKQTKHFL